MSKSSGSDFSNAETRLNNLISGLSEELQSDSHIESSKSVKGLKCARCCQPIATEEEGCHALGENFHNSCFHCNRCGSQLVNKKFVHSNNRVYCEACYSSKEISQMLPFCAICFQEITDNICTAMGRRFHTNCFRCIICKRPLSGAEFRLGPGPEWEPLCLHDWGERYAPRCGGCRQPILPPANSDRIECYQASQPQSNVFHHFHCFNKK